MPTCFNPPTNVYRFCKPCCPAQCCCPGLALFSFPKVDAVTGAGIRGAVFELRRGGVPVATAVSNTAGIVCFPTPAAGTYTLVETIPPAGYQPQTRTFAVTVDAYGAISVDGAPISQFRVPNTPIRRGVFTLVKYDVTTGAGLGGAGFELRQGSTVVGSAVSGPDGAFEFTGLPAGTYTLVETVPPTGYQPVRESHLVVVAPDGSVTVDGVPARDVLIGNAPVASDVYFTKVDSETGAPLENAVFELLNGNTVIASAVSDAAGRVSFGVQPVGTYTIREVLPPAGYELNMTAYTAVVNADGSVTVNGVPSAYATVPNTPEAVVTDVSFTKVDSQTGALLGNAVFELLSGTTVIGTAVSEVGTGRVSFGVQPAGSYTIREVTPPAGYQPNTALYTAVVSADGSVTIDGVPAASATVPDTREAGTYELYFTKVDSATGAVLGNAVFELLSGSTVIATATSDVSGRLTFGSQPAGTYTIREVTPPAGYQPNMALYTAVVSADGSVTIDGVPAASATVPNTREEGTYELYFTKVDSATGAVLGNAVFELLSGSTVIATATSDVSGRLTFGSQPVGTYTIREVTPPAGYQPNTALYTAVVSADGSVTIDGVAAALATIPNTPSTAPADITFQVADAVTGAPVSGTVYQLLSDGVVVGTATSNANGTVNFGSQAPGSYTIRELTPAAGYLPNTQMYTAVVGADGTVTIDGVPADTFIVRSSPLAMLTVLKTDAAGAPLSGAAFELRLNGTAIRTVTTGADGRAMFEGLLAGTYTLVETVPPTGYQADATVHTVVVDANGGVTVDGQAGSTLSVVDTPVSLNIVFRKVNSATGNPLSGALFVLESDLGPVGIASSDATGLVTLTSLGAGTYTIREIAVPTGFLPSSAAYTAVVDAQGNVTIDGTPADAFSAPNAPVNGLEIQKLNTAGQPLSGAVFELRQNGVAISTQTTDAVGLATFANLPNGTYTLVETVPPTGFQPNGITYTVVKTDTGVTVNAVPLAGVLPVENLPVLFDVFFTKRDGETGSPVAGAAFTLSNAAGTVATATSDALGTVNFGTQAAGSYNVTEIAPAAGYQLNPVIHAAVVAPDGTVTVDGMSADAAVIANIVEYNVRVTQVNTQGVPIFGAQFEVLNGATPVQTAYTNADGNVYFRGLDAGSYTLVQAAPAPGYQADATPHTLTVTADGAVTVDGAATKTLAVTSRLLPSYAMFIKRNGETGRPLGGAAFELSSGAVAIPAVSSPLSGVVTFGQLAQGTYTLRETSAPSGFTPSVQTYTVLVTADGTVTVDGSPIAGFSVSNDPIPNLNDVYRNN